MCLKFVVISFLLWLQLFALILLLLLLLLFLFFVLCNDIRICPWLDSQFFTINESIILTKKKIVWNNGTRVWVYIPMRHCLSGARTISTGWATYTYFQAHHFNEWSQRCSMRSRYVMWYRTKVKPVIIWNEPYSTFYPAPYGLNVSHLFLWLAIKNTRNEKNKKFKSTDSELCRERESEKNETEAHWTYRKMKKEKTCTRNTRGTKINENTRLNHHTAINEADSKEKHNKSRIEIRSH